MDFEVIINNIKKTVDFYEKSYETSFWKLSDKGLNEFLTINYNNYFKDKGYCLFYKVMLSYVEAIIVDAMSDNKIVINKEYMYNNLYLIRFINIQECLDFPKYEDIIKEELRIVYELGQKKLTKKI